MRPVQNGDGFGEAQRGFTLDPVRPIAQHHLPLGRLSAHLARRRIGEFPYVLAAREGRHIAAGRHPPSLLAYALGATDHHAHLAFHAPQVLPARYPAAIQPHQQQRG